MDLRQYLEDYQLESDLDGFGPDRLSSYVDYFCEDFQCDVFAYDIFIIGCSGGEVIFKK